MALILTLRKGHDFYVAGRRVVVSKIFSATNFTLKNDEGKVFNVSDTRWEEVLPGVRIQAGIPRDQSTAFVRVSIEAPGKKVLRGEAYRESKKSVCEACGGAGVLSQPVPHADCQGHGCVFCDSGSIQESFVCPDCGGLK